MMEIPKQPEEQGMCGITPELLDRAKHLANQMTKTGERHVPIKLIENGEKHLGLLSLDNRNMITIGTFIYEDKEYYIGIPLS